MALPKRVVRKVDENSIYTAEEMMESLAELAGFTVFEVYDEHKFAGYSMEAVDEDLRAFLAAETAAEAHEAEDLVNEVYVGTCIPEKIDDFLANSKEVERIAIVGTDSERKINHLSKIADTLRIDNDKLLAERNQLIKDNQILSKELQNIQERCADLEDEITDMKRTKKFLTSEEAGRRLAQDMTGGIQ